MGTRGSSRQDEVGRGERATVSYPALPVGAKLPEFLKHGTLSASSTLFICMWESDE